MKNPLSLEDITLNKYKNKILIKLYMYLMNGYICVVIKSCIINIIIIIFIKNRKFYYDINKNFNMYIHKFFLKL